MKQSGDLENLKEQERLKEMKQFAYNMVTWTRWQR